jgi:hypothetical protein
MNDKKFSPLTVECNVRAVLVKWVLAVVYLVSSVLALIGQSKAMQLMKYHPRVIALRVFPFFLITLAV